MTEKTDGTALTGVSETALLTLQVRATEARRPDSIIDDPMAIKLVDAIDFDFAKFGFTRRQDMALRALAFDNYTRRYLDRPSVGHRRRARRGAADQLLPPRRVGRGGPIPLAHCRSATDDRASRATAAAL